MQDDKLGLHKGIILHKGRNQGYIEPTKHIENIIKQGSLRI